MGPVKAENQQQNSAHLPPESAEVHVRASAETFLIVKLCGKNWEEAVLSDKREKQNPSVL